MILRFEPATLALSVDSVKNLPLRRQQIASQFCECANGTPAGLKVGEPARYLLDVAVVQNLDKDAGGVRGKVQADIFGCSQERALRAMASHSRL